MSLFPIIPSSGPQLRFVQSHVVENPGVDIVVPSGVLAGDLLVFHNITRSAPGGAVQPSGFTEINVASRNESGTICVVSLYYKIAVGTESGTTLTGMPDDSDNAIELLHFRADQAIVSVTAGDVEGSVSPNGLSFTCSASAGTAPLVVIGAYVDGDSSGIGATSMTPTEDATITNGAYVQVKYKIYNDSPQNTGLTLADGGNFNCLQSCYLQVAFA